MKTAIVIGATGMVGNQLIHLLLKDSHFNKIVVFGRRSLGIKDDKLEEHLINFDQPETWQHLVKGDILFSSLGTTFKQAGSQEVQYRIDFTYQYQFAETASRNGVPVYVLVSSSGADPGSRIFYSRMKGELERDIKKLSFKSIYILQPSLLVGPREKERLGEKAGFGILKVLNSVGLFSKYRPIHGKIVAQAMINGSIAGDSGIHTYTLTGVFKLAEYILKQKQNK